MGLQSEKQGAPLAELWQPGNGCPGQWSHEMEVPKAQLQTSPLF